MRAKHTLVGTLLCSVFLMLSSLPLAVLAGAV